MIKKFLIQDDGLVPVESGEAPILAFIDPTAEEREALRRTYKIDDHTLSSTLDPDELSRVETHPDHLFVIWKRPRDYSATDTSSFNVGSMGFFLYSDRLWIIATDDIQPDDTPKTRPMRTAQDAMLAIMHQSVHHYTEHLRAIKKVARELQEQINQSMENRHLIQMFNLSESLVYYLNAVDSNRAVLTRLRDHAPELGLTADVIPFIDDLAIESNQCYKQAEIYSTILSGLMDARGSIVNNNMNVLLKNLTVINVVFLPLGLIAGIGGMSEFGKITQGIDWRIAYGLLLVTMVILGWLTALLLKRVKSGAKATGAARR